MTERGTIRAWARGEVFVSEVHVFGSVARGEGGDDSDLDLAVVASGDENRTALGNGIALQARWSAELQRLLPGRVVDLNVTDPEGGEEIVWPAVLKEGVILYRRPS